MSDCLFCRIINGEIPAQRIYEDDQIVVIPDKYPKARVHLLVMPRKHLPSLVELDPEHDSLMGYMLRLLPSLARAQGLEDGFRTVINTGRGGGQEIFHLHVHLLGGESLGGL